MRSVAWALWLWWDLRWRCWVGLGDIWAEGKPEGVRWRVLSTWVVRGEGRTSLRMGEERGSPTLARTPRNKVFRAWLTTSQRGRMRK